MHFFILLPGYHAKICSDFQTQVIFKKKKGTEVCEVVGAVGEGGGGGVRVRIICLPWRSMLYPLPLSLPIDEGFPCHS